MTENASLLLVGCGRMGSAMLSGWLAQGTLARCIVLEPDPAATAGFDGDPRVTVAQAIAQVPEDLSVDATMLAVKPQIMADVLPVLAGLLPTPRPLILSIAAGTGLATIERALGPGPVIRIMPNTPAAIGKGMSVLCANAAARDSDRTLAERLMAGVGAVAWIAEERHMNAVTAISGSGPAYVFHLIEAMAAAGEALGLAPDIAMHLARQTVIGAAALAEAEPGTSAAALREAVTSPGGTTAAALAVLAQPQALRALMAETAKAAAERSAELA